MFPLAFKLILAPLIDILSAALFALDIESVIKFAVVKLVVIFALATVKLFVMFALLAVTLAVTFTLPATLALPVATTKSPV